MRPISRRDALLLGGLGTAATVAGGAGLWWSLASAQQPIGGSASRGQAPGCAAPRSFAARTAGCSSPSTPPAGGWNSGAGPPAPSVTTAPSRAPPSACGPVMSSASGS